MSKKTVVFIDSGDTIINEGTEIRDNQDIVIDAEVIPGGDMLLRELKNQGYRVALVADGIDQSFYNMYRKLGLMDCFEQMIISSVVGEEKPSPRMFETALRKMNLTKEDCSHIVMMGNNVERDIVGANAQGITSVLIDWSPRYRMTPNTKEETPDYIVHNPYELLDVLQELEEKLS